MAWALSNIACGSPLLVEVVEQGGVALDLSAHAAATLVLSSVEGVRRLALEVQLLGFRVLDPPFQRGDHVSLLGALDPGPRPLPRLDSSRHGACDGLPGVPELAEVAVEGYELAVPDLLVPPKRAVHFGGGSARQACLLDLQGIGDGLVLAQQSAYDSLAGVVLDVLRHVAEPGAWVQVDRAAGHGLVAEQYAKDGRLAGAVGADQAELLAGVDLKGGAFEHGLGAVVCGDVMEARSLSEKQCSNRYASLMECKDANYSTTKSKLL